MLPEEIRNTKEFNGTSSIDVLPSSKGNLEYIKPLKISQNQYEDPRKYLKYINKISVYVWEIVYNSTFEIVYKSLYKSTNCV